MPVTKTYVCDQCGSSPEWNYKTVETHIIKSPLFVNAMYEVPQPDPIYCSMECLGKSLQWWADKYDKEHNEKV